MKVVRGKRKRYGPLQRNTKKIVLGVLAVLLLGGIAALVVAILGGRTTAPVEEESSVVETVSVSETSEASQKPEETTIDPATMVLTKQSSDWQLLLVNAYNPVPDGYQVELTTYDDVELDKRVLDAYKAMHAAAQEDGYTLWISSGYRSPEKQQELIDAEVKKNMRDEGLDEEAALQKAMLTITEPGYSEHNTGLAIDLNGVTSIGTPEYEWLCEHAPEYGFILRYPENKEDITGINFEGWHFRYVGVEHAKYITEHNMCLEEYIAYLLENDQL